MANDNKDVGKEDSALLVGVLTDAGIWESCFQYLWKLQTINVCTINYTTSISNTLEKLFHQFTGRT